MALRGRLLAVLVLVRAVVAIRAQNKVKAMVTTPAKVCTGVPAKIEYLADFDVLFFCFFRNFKAVLMVFVFRASISIFSLRFCI